MLLAALLDAGLEIDALRRGLAGVDLGGYDLELERVQRHGVQGARLRVRVDEGQPARDWAQIRALIAGGRLSDRARSMALGAFGRLARAEAAIHGVPVDAVHFHEVGAVDSIVDMVGFCVGVDILSVSKIYASPLPLGRGWVRTQHGPLPVPAPATLALLAEVSAPIIPAPPGSDGELLTPTAAALLAELATFGQPPMRVQRVGYGLGSKEFPRLNGLRIWLGESDAAEGDGRESLSELRCNLDDVTGEALAYAIERLLASGALDAWAAPLVMKKGRPAYQLACLARPGDVAPLTDIILRETPSLGVRWSPVERRAAGRDSLPVETPWGAVRVKRKLIAGEVAGGAPEYEDCAALARASGAPLADIYRAALRAAGL
ncbi:nickel pincer cofactor biosynthesis protein LarC [Oscillochloris sp. ZM17-4]|nr:nickel pincer cofactor biosynthesis protein LarC [Oscillochloris sp. ZM17-4]